MFSQFWSCYQEAWGLRQGNQRHPSIHLFIHPSTHPLWPQHQKHALYDLEDFMGLGGLATTNLAFYLRRWARSEEPNLIYIVKVSCMGDPAIYGYKLRACKPSGGHHFHITKTKCVYVNILSSYYLCTYDWLSQLLHVTIQRYKPQHLP